MKNTDRQVQAPLLAVSTASSLMNKTGTWRFAKPVFIDRLSPCHQQCPADEDITGYMYLAAQGKIKEAWELIMEQNPFPAVMGRVCYHTCETRCNREKLDSPVSIHTVERFIGDYGLAHEFRVEPMHPDTQKKVAVVGAGPAGLSAAYHLRMKGHDVTVYDANELPGGLMRYGIPAYRLPKEILDGEISRLYHLGIHFELDARLGETLPWDDLDDPYDALFIATGAYKEADPGIEGTVRAGVFKALDFLNNVNTNNSPSMARNVAVVGGGNSALDCARVCRRLGAEVTVVYRRSGAEMPAHPEEVELAREEGIQFQFLASPSEIYGEDKVTGVKVSKMALGEPDASGRRKPVPTGESFELYCGGIIFAIGESPDKKDLPPFLELTQGVVETDEQGKSLRDHCFAGGDITNIPRSVTHAIGSGKRAAEAIHRALDREKDNVALLSPSPLPFHRRNPSSEVVAYEGLNPFYFDKRPRIEPRTMSPQERVKGFGEVVLSSPEDAVIGEARRCFNCGACTECGNCHIFCPEISVIKDPNGFGYQIEMDYCKGCGICVKECPRGAMKMEFME
jgi:NADPH-dependent glutamate synthase beta subunit-like oxidoreductase